MHSQYLDTNLLFPHFGKWGTIIFLWLCQKYDDWWPQRSLAAITKSQAKHHEDDEEQTPQNCQTLGVSRQNRAARDYMMQQLMAGDTVLSTDRGDGAIPQRRRRRFLGDPC